MKKLFFGALCAILLTAGQVWAAAETLTATEAVAGVPLYGKGQAGNLKMVYGTYSVAANVEDGDIFEMVRIPGGATVVGGRFYADDLDTGTETLDMDVGWAANGTEAADPDGLLNAGVLTGDAVTGVKPETGTSMPLGGVLIPNGSQYFSQETVIQIEANAAAATFAAGDITLVIFYTMD